MFMAAPATDGTGLTLEVVVTVAELLLGLPAAGMTRVYASPHPGRPVSRAGWAYTFLRIVMVGTRGAFSYGSVDWFHVELGQWMVDTDVAA
ncbi:hypothetical protein ACFRLW_41690, partial [Streptomyces sp. NPDC056728]